MFGNGRPRIRNVRLDFGTDLYPDRDRMNFPKFLDKGKSSYKGH